MSSLPGCGTWLRQPQETNAALVSRVLELAQLSPSSMPYMFCLGHSFSFLCPSVLLLPHHMSPVHRMSPAQPLLLISGQMRLSLGFSRLGGSLVLETTSVHEPLLGPTSLGDHLSRETTSFGEPPLLRDHLSWGTTSFGATTVGGPSLLGATSVRCPQSPALTTLYHNSVSMSVLTTRPLI